MNSFGYRSDTNLYFGRVSITVMIFVACGLMVLTQLFMTIWFLVYHDWWWFITLACVIIGNGLLLLSIKFRNPDFIRIVLVYQALYVALCMGTIVYMVLLLCHPYKDTPFFRNCMDIRNHGKDKDKKPYKFSKEDCIKKTRVLGGIFAGIYTLFALINLFCATVIYNYFKYMIETGPIRSKPENRAAPRPATSPMASTPSNPVPEGPATNLRTVENGENSEYLPPPGTVTAMRPSSTVSMDSRPVFTLSPASTTSSQQSTVTPPVVHSQESIAPDWDSAPAYNPYVPQSYNQNNEAPPPVPSHYGRDYSSQY